MDSPVKSDSENAVPLVSCTEESKVTPVKKRRSRNRGAKAALKAENQDVIVENGHEKEEPPCTAVEPLLHEEKKEASTELGASEATAKEEVEEKDAKKEKKKTRRSRNKRKSQGTEEVATVEAVDSPTCPAIVTDIVESMSRLELSTETPEKKPQENGAPATASDAPQRKTAKVKQTGNANRT